MINTIFHFVNDPTFDYQTAVNNGDISEYTIVFNSADHSIHCKGTMFGRMSRADIAETLGNISDLIPVATDSTLGGIKIGYTNNADLNSRRYGVVLDDNNKAYVEVPWTDTITPDFDDTDLKNLIATERSRIDNFISTLSTTIDAKNRQLFADTQWVEEVFGIPQAEGSIWQKFENEIDHYLNEYMVWDWVDPNDHTKGRTAKISSIKLDIDGITTRVGTTEQDISGITTRTSTLELTASSLTARVGAVETKADGIDTALSSFEQTVNTEIGGIKTAHTNLSSSIASYESTNDGNIGNLIKMAAAVLDLKASSDAEGNLSTTTDLANVITNGSFSGYSGLSQRVSQTESGISANASLIADVQGAVNGLDIDGAVTRATAGFATETWVGLNYDTIGSAATAESNAKGYADNIVAGAKADVIASIDDTVAGMSVLVTKDTNGYIDSNIYLKANQIYLDGLTNFKNAVGAFVKTDVLEAGVADIKARLTVGGSDPDGAGTSGSITMKNASDGTIGIWDKDKLAVGTTSSPSSSNSAMFVNADGSGSLAKGNISWDASGNVTTSGSGIFGGELIGATGSFSGEVSASEFIAGDNVNGFSINIVPLAFLFNWKGTPLAWFSLCDWDETNNTFAAPTSNPKGFYLYMRNPVDGHMITIDFANISNGFKDLNANSNPVYTYPLYSITRLNGNVAYDPVISQDRDVYYTDVNGTKTWYSNSQGTTALSSVSGYRKASINYGTGPNTGSPMLNPYVLKQLSINHYDLVKADIYIGQTLSSGQVVDDTSRIVVVVTDTDGHYKICTPISGNPKSVSGASNVYYQGVLSNNFAGGHRDVGTSSTSVSAYVVDLASTTGNIYSGNSVTYFDNNNNTTSMLATTYPAAS